MSPWIRVDDVYPEHPKMIEAGPLAMALDVAGIAYASRNRTDGRIPKGVVPRLLDMAEFDVTCEQMAERLVKVGRWHDDGTAYTVHDFADYNPTKDLSEKRREAGKKGAAARWNKPETPKPEVDKVEIVCAKVQKTLIDSDRYEMQDIEPAVTELEKRLRTGEDITSPVSFAGNAAERLRRERGARIRKAAEEKAARQEVESNLGIDTCDHGNERRECETCREANRQEIARMKDELRSLRGGV